MPTINDDCSTLVGQCVAVLLRPDVCLNPADTVEPPTITGAVTQIGVAKPTDPNDAFLTYQASCKSYGTNVNVVQKFDDSSVEQIDVNGCTYWIIKTCALPATVDADYDPDDPASPIRALFGAEYKITVVVNGKKCGPWTFGIDAAEDYTPVEVDGCIPVTELIELDQQLPPASAGFSDAVCATQCIMDLQAQVDAITGAISTVTDNGDGTFSHDPGDGSTPTQVSVCDLLDDLPETGVELPADGTIKLLGDDCQWHDAPTRCCIVDTVLSDPATGDPVVVAIDTDTGDATYFDVNGQPWTGDPATLELPGGAATDTNSISTVTDNNDGSFSHNPGDGSTPTTIPVCDLLDDLAANTDTPLPDGIQLLGSDCQWYDPPPPTCSVTAGPGGGLTGTPNGAYTDSCTIEPMSADGDPETDYPPADFPEGWRQLFSGGTTGTESWIILNDTNGAPQWHQTA